MQSLFKKSPVVRKREQLFAEKEMLLEAEKPEVLKPCGGCGAALPLNRWEQEMAVCPACGKHERISARRRIEITVDPGSFMELANPVVIQNPLGFPGYEDKLQKSRAACGTDDALLCGIAKIGGYETALGVMDTNFMMGSMGAAVGEGLAALSDMALEKKLPLVVFCCSGGARMQEGMVSLMQMAKVSMSFERLAAQGLLYVAVLTDPTTGGVTASFAMLGDIIIAEPGTLVGFTGPRVIQQTIRQELPEGFQRAEFMLEHGFIDLVAPRRELPRTLATILMIHGAHK